MYFSNLGVKEFFSTRASVNTRPGRALLQVTGRYLVFTPHTSAEMVRHSGAILLESTNELGRLDTCQVSREIPEIPCKVSDERCSMSCAPTQAACGAGAFIADSEQETRLPCGNETFAKMRHRYNCCEPSCTNSRSRSCSNAPLLFVLLLGLALQTIPRAYAVLFPAQFPTPFGNGLFATSGRIVMWPKSFSTRTRRTAWPTPRKKSKSDCFENSAIWAPPPTTFYTTLHTSLNVTIVCVVINFSRDPFGC